MKYKRNQSNPKLDKANKIIKVIYFLLYFALNLFIIGTLVHEGMQPIEENSLNGFALVLALIGIMIGLPGNGVISFVALIGLIVAACNKRNPKRGKVVLSYVFLILLPIITEALIIGCGQYVSNLLA